MNPSSDSKHSRGSSKSKVGLKKNLITQSMDTITAQKSKDESTHTSLTRKGNDVKGVLNQARGSVRRDDNH